MLHENPKPYLFYFGTEGEVAGVWILQIFVKHCQDRLVAVLFAVDYNKLDKKKPPPPESSHQIAFSELSLVPLH